MRRPRSGGNTFATGKGSSGRKSGRQRGGSSAAKSSAESCVPGRPLREILGRLPPERRARTEAEARSIVDTVDRQQARSRRNAPRAWSPPAVVRLEISPVTPGAILAEELQVRGLTPVVFADQIGVVRQQLRLVLAGRRPITPALARRLEWALGPSARFWVNLQRAYDRHRQNAAGRRRRSAAAG